MAGSCSPKEALGWSGALNEGLTHGLLVPCGPGQVVRKDSGRSSMGSSLSIILSLYTLELRIFKTPPFRGQVLFSRCGQTESAVHGGPWSQDHQEQGRDTLGCCNPSWGVCWLLWLIKESRFLRDGQFPTLCQLIFSSWFFESSFLYVTELKSVPL